MRNLLVIARTGSFSLAAKELMISQPALSASIAQLEARVGGRLFDRGRNGAAVTPLGSTLLRHAEIVDTQLRRASEEMRLGRQQALGPLNLAITPIASAYGLLRAVGQLKAEFPNAVINVKEMVFTDALAEVRRGSIDVCLGPLGVYAANEHVVEEQLSSDTFCLIARAGSRVLTGRKQSLRSLGDAQWVLPSDRSAYHHQLEALFSVGGVPWPTQAIFTNSAVAIKTIVANSDCISIAPRQMIQLELKAGVLVQCDLIEAGMTRAFGFACSADRPLMPLAQRFVDILREQSRAPVSPKPPKRC
ncbi:MULTISPECIES: LysR family transcriptional regulator [unclassified Beijerinckia]|uniref:LysR family transcriptional regulator n=1 Tax=unclassified Beijerinckia TaxID=2638183 RepID=UPI00147D908A|nr:MULTISPECIES: LysR family transcriptional regulator [unclassified Beijerinckia]